MLDYYAIRTDEKREWRKTPAPEGQEVFGEKDADNPQDGMAQHLQVGLQKSARNDVNKLV